MTDKKHSEIGASKAKEWFNCPGSVRLQKLGYNRTNIAAIKGNEAHDIAEQVLNIGKQTNFHFKGNSQVKELLDTLEHDMQEAVKLYVNTILNDIVQFVEQNPEQAKHFDVEKHLLVEQFLTSKLHENLYGTADAILILPTKFIVYDFKTGTGEDVHASNNLQLKYYTLLAWESLGFYCEEMENVIVQPRLSEYMDKEDLGPIRRADLNKDELVKFRNELIEAVGKVYQSELILNKGDHCKWCTAHGICPEYNKILTKTTNSNFELPNLKRMTVKRMKDILTHKKQIENFLKALQRHVQEGVLHGDIDPEKVGFKVVEGRPGNRAWKNEQRVVKYLTSKEIDPYKTSVVSPAQVFARIKARPDKKEIEDILNENIERPEGKPSLVPIDAAGEALSTRQLVENDYEVIE